MKLCINLPPCPVPRICWGRIMMIICHWGMYLCVNSMIIRSLMHWSITLRIILFPCWRMLWVRRLMPVFFITVHWDIDTIIVRNLVLSVPFCLMVSSIHLSIRDREKILNRIPVFMKVVPGTTVSMFLTMWKDLPVSWVDRNLSLKNFSVSLTMDSMILPMNPTLLMLISFLISRVKNGVRKRRPSGFCRNILRMLPTVSPVMMTPVRCLHGPSLTW